MPSSPVIFRNSYSSILIFTCNCCHTTSFLYSNTFLFSFLHSSNKNFPVLTAKIFWPIIFFYSNFKKISKLLIILLASIKDSFPRFSLLPFSFNPSFAGFILDIKYHFQTSTPYMSNTYCYVINLFQLKNINVNVLIKLLVKKHACSR